MAGFSEELTERFYNWERRGRGWQVWPHQVSLEPPFYPFFHYIAPAAAQDTGHRLGLFERVSRLFAPQEEPPIRSTRLPEDDEQSDDRVESATGRTEFQFLIPDKFRTAPASAKAFLSGLRGCTFPVSFEILGTPERVHTLFSCSLADQRNLKRHLVSYSRDAVCRQSSEFLESCWERAGNQVCLVDFGLSHEFMLPLKVLSKPDEDLLTGLVSSSTELGPDELTLLQVLFQPASFDWPESIARSAMLPSGEPFFDEFPDFGKLAREKTAQPLFAVAIRVAALSHSVIRARDLAVTIATSLLALDRRGSNELIPLHNEEYDPALHEFDLLHRTTHRTGMLLNLDELASLVHLPWQEIQIPEFLCATANSRPCPPSCIGYPIVLGTCEHLGKTQEVSLSNEHRLRHLHFLGASGSGKTTLLRNLILQDLQQGNGFAVLDPHGDLIDDIICQIPKNRHKDVIYFDPSDEHYPVGLNILSAHSETERTLLASDLVAVFRRLSTSWGDQMNSILANAVIAFLESSRGGTLLDLKRFLVDPSFRSDFLKTVTDQEIVYYWKKTYPVLRSNAHGPILTRLDTFLRPKMIRYMVAQRENRVDFRAVMDEGKIFLAKLAMGSIGEENAYLLGSLLVAKIHQAALSRQSLRPEQRKNFFLYIDECHNFLTPSICPLLTGARKFGVGLVLAHQELRQLGTAGSEISSTVLANPYTRVCFRLGDDDARKLADGFGGFEVGDLQNLRIGQAIARAERAEFSFRLNVPHGLKFAGDAADPDELIAASRARYATPRDMVEEQLRFTPPEEVAKDVRSQKKRVHREDAKAEPVPDIGTIEVETNHVLDEKRPAIQTAQMAEAPAKEPEVPIAMFGSEPVSAIEVGKGGAKHRWLQKIIKSSAESLGFRAEIEQSIPGGGFVDIAIEGEGVKLACEVSVTTRCDHELANIQKCLASGFDAVMAISTDAVHLERLCGLVSTSCSMAERAKVHLGSPDDVIDFLKQFAPSKPAEKTVRGYKVSVEVQNLSPSERAVREQAIAEIVGKNMQKRVTARKPNVLS
jgi:hypothetical protein